MNLGDICICGHTREVHFGGDCAHNSCRCLKFVLIDHGPMLLRVLRQINEVATHTVFQAEAIHQIKVWSEKAIRIAEGS
jgi:hypothetical protein